VISDEIAVGKLNSVFKVRFLELLLQKTAHKKLLLQTGSKNPYSAELQKYLAIFAKC